ncbi:hypothetical protein WN71_029930 [Streptomyces mangrovisoli]|uniref:Uncharacterized protein n=1 Tax=Streptomyces mangrovisoli TaxID=1428628 RepID=A0A1J4NPK8_9ACTN|nr:hypothetical protein WN71_029930 [Streptomyces mangrovisoli]
MIGVCAVLAAVLERVLTVMGGTTLYILCDDVSGLSAELDRQASVNRWLLAAAVVLAAATTAASRIRRWRVLAALSLAAVLTLVVLADGFAARADAVAEQISKIQTCDEPTDAYDVSRGWFDWTPLGP